MVDALHLVVYIAKTDEYHARRRARRSVQNSLPI